MDNSAAKSQIRICLIDVSFSQSLISQYLIRCSANERLSFSVTQTRNVYGAAVPQTSSSRRLYTTGTHTHTLEIRSTVTMRTIREKAGGSYLHHAKCFYAAWLMRTSQLSSQLRYVFIMSVRKRMKCPHIQVKPTHTHTHLDYCSISTSVCDNCWNQFPI